MNKITPEEYISYLKVDNRGFNVLEDYINSYTKIKHVCLEGHVWSAAPRNIRSGHGCPHCSGHIPQDYRQYLEEDGRGFIVLEQYIHNKIKIKHRCSKGHEWSVKPNDIKNGSGCPVCSYHGFNPNQPAVLYYLSVSNGKAYKIGITNTTVSKRYSNKELLNITLLKEWYFDNGQEAYSMEQAILKQYREFKYKGKKLLKSGNTELFFLDVLGLDIKGVHNENV